MQAAIQQQFADQGMSEEQIEQATAMTSMFTGTIPTFITFIFVGLLSGLLIGLIAGVFMKREAAPMR
jgi:hypothetical protein